MMTDITIKIKNSEQDYKQKFTERDFYSPETVEKIKGMINMAMKCVTVAEGALSEGINIEIKTTSLWQ